MARRALGPASLRAGQSVAEALERRSRPDDPVTGVVVAVSGGADSLALAAATAWAASRGEQGHQLTVRAVVVDHQLQRGSAEVAERAAQQARDLGLDATVITTSVEPHHPGGPEAAAREARYAALDATRSPGEVILLGHTLDDQAETVLLGLARGSGTRSLAGMAPAAGHYLRPLLGLTRQDTEAACAEQGLVPWEDPHNDDPRYARVRARRALRVLDEALGPGLAAALARTAALARDDADLLDALGGQALPPEPTLDADRAAALPPALRSRAVLTWLRARGVRDVTAQHVAAVLDLVDRWRGQKGVDLPGGRVTRSHGRLHYEAGLG